MTKVERKSRTRLYLLRPVLLGSYLGERSQFLRVIGLARFGIIQPSIDMHTRPLRMLAESKSRFEDVNIQTSQRPGSRHIALRNRSARNVS
jgi:hypothetical protein